MNGGYQIPECGDLVHLQSSPVTHGGNLNVNKEHRVTTEVDHRKGSWNNQEKGPASQQRSPSMS